MKKTSNLIVILLISGSSFSQTLRFGNSVNGSVQLAFDINRHFEAAAGFNKIWGATSVPSAAVSVTYKLKQQKTPYITLGNTFAFLEHKTTDLVTGISQYSYYDALCLSTGYQFNFWKRCDLRLGAGVAYIRSYAVPVSPVLECTFAIRFKKQVPVRSITIGNN